MNVIALCQTNTLASLFPLERRNKTYDTNTTERGTWSSFQICDGLSGITPKWGASVFWDDKCELIALIQGWIAPSCAGGNLFRISQFGICAWDLWLLASDVNRLRVSDWRLFLSALVMVAPDLTYLSRRLSLLSFCEYYHWLFSINNLYLDLWEVNAE